MRAEESCNDERLNIALTLRVSYYKLKHDLL